MAEAEVKITKCGRLIDETGFGMQITHLIFLPIIVLNGLNTVYYINQGY